MNKDVAVIFQEDLKLIQILKNGAEFVGGHYQIPLIFRNDEVNVPKNRSQAEKIIACLERKLSRNPRFKQDYMKFMKELCKEINICCREWKMLVFTSSWGPPSQQTWENRCNIWLECGILWNINEQGPAVMSWPGKQNNCGIAEVQGRANCSYWWYWGNVSSSKNAR